MMSQLLGTAGLEASVVIVSWAVSQLDCEAFIYFRQA